MPFSVLETTTIYGPKRKSLQNHSKSNQIRCTISYMYRSLKFVRKQSKSRVVQEIISITGHQ